MVEETFPDRQSGLVRAITEAQIDAIDSGEDSVVVACIGPPWCQSGGTPEEMKQCLTCDHYIIEKNGAVNRAASISQLLS